MSARYSGDSRYQFIEANVANLTAAGIEDETVGLVIASSLLHDVKSYYGQTKMDQALSEFKRVLAPQGLFLIREFRPQSQRPCILKLNSDFSRRFFPQFNSCFEPGKREKWRSVEQIEEDTFKTSRRYAQEVMLHCRHLYRDWTAEETDDGREKVLTSLASKAWDQLDESYIPARNGQSYEEPKQMIEDLGLADPQYATASYQVINHEDDPWIREHFALFSTEGEELSFHDTRMVILAQKVDENSNVSHAKMKFRKLRQMALDNLQLSSTEKECYVFRGKLIK